MMGRSIKAIAGALLVMLVVGIMAGGVFVIMNVLALK